MAKKQKKVTDIIIPEKEEIISKNQTTTDQEPMETDVSGSGNIIIEKSNVIIEPLKKRHEKHYKGKPHHLIVDLIIAAVVVLMIGLTVFVYWGVGAQYDAKNLEASITLEPEEIKSIQDVKFTIDYKNTNQIDLLDTKLVLILPDGFELTEVDPADKFNQTINTIEIDEMPANSSGKIQVSGALISPVTDYDTFEIDFIVNYKSRIGITRKDVKSVSYNISADESSLGFEIDSFPSNLINNQITDYKFNVSNNSDIQIKNIVITPTFPANFELSSSSLTDNKINALDSGQTQLVSFKGRINEQEDGELEKDFIFELSIQPNGKAIKQAKIKKTALIVFPKAEVTAKLKNGKANVFPSELLEYTIAYENKGEDDLLNVVISTELTGLFLNLHSIRTDGEIDNNTIIWKEISVLKPGEKGEKSFSVRVYPYINLAKSEKKSNFSVKVMPSITYVANEMDEPFKINGLVIEKKVNSMLTFNPDGRYYFEGEQIGRGPLPPRVNQATLYWIFGQIQNTTNAVENIVISGTLGPNVGWFNKTGGIDKGTEISYDQSTNQVVWKVDSLAELGNSDAGFAVNFTPSVDQVGQLGTLFSNISITAKDKWTGADLTLLSTNVTTDLTYDDKEKGKGKVAF